MLIMLTTQLIINLLLILGAAWVLGSVFARFGLPVVLGEMLAGVILGPPLLGLVTGSSAIELMAEFGIFFVMFYTGMEMDPRELLEHFWQALTVALGGFVLPFVLGYLATRAFGGTVYQSLYVGMCISITAIAVQSIVLHSLKINRTEVGHIIIGGAIADDIFSLIGLSILLGVSKTGTLQWGNILWIGLAAAGFFGITLALGHWVVPRLTRRLHDREGKAFTFAIMTALVMAYLAELAGLHLIIGAFLAGQFVRKEIMEESLYRVIADRFYAISYGFLVPIFMASLSFHLHFQWDWFFIGFTLAITAMAILGKLVGCGLGYYLFRRNPWEALIVGLGMNGRGAVELVVITVVINLSNQLLSQKTLSQPLLTETQFSALIMMAFITTLFSPLALKWSVQRTCLPNEKADFCRVWEKG